MAHSPNVCAMTGCEFKWVVLVHFVCESGENNITVEQTARKCQYLEGMHIASVFTWSSVAMLFRCCADFSMASLRDLAYCTMALSCESVSTHSRSSRIRISLEATTLQSLICNRQVSRVYSRTKWRWCLCLRVGD